MWPGGDKTYRNVSPTYQWEFEETVSFRVRIDTALSWYTNVYKPANLVMLYLNEPDRIGHEFGPDSLQMKIALHEIDRVTKYLFDR